MDNQASDSKASNEINGYISWDSNASSLSDDSSTDPDENERTPLELLQSVPVMTPRAMVALPPPDEHHVNFVRDELLPGDFNATFQQIAANPPNIQANIKLLLDSQALLTQMFNYNLSPGQDSSNFLREYTAQYGTDSRNMY